MRKVDFSDIPFELTVEEIYDRMTYRHALDMVALLEAGGYTARPLSLPEVDEWYINATYGQKNHMANKLAKNGYPEQGVHSKDKIQTDAYAKGCKHGTMLAKLTSPKTLRKTLDQHTTGYILRTLKELGVSPMEIVQAAVRLQN